MTELKTQKPREERKRTKKVFASLAAVTLVGVAGVAGTTAALSGSTENPDNRFDAAYVEIGDNDSEGFMYQVDAAKTADDPTERCILVTYTGSALADVKLSVAGAIGPVTPYVDLTVEAAPYVLDPANPPAFSGDAASCAPYVSADFEIVSPTGTLKDFQTDNATAPPLDPATGVAYSPNGAGTQWEKGDSVVYRFSLELTEDDRLDGEDTSGLHTYTWRADAV